MIDKLTIITTLVNSQSSQRAVQAQRFIEYHKRFNCNIVVVCPKDVDISGIDHNLPNLTIIHCDSGTTIEDKFLLTIESIKTPYVSWIADDDFLGMDFAEKSIRKLDEKSFVAGCIGMQIFYEEKSCIRKDIMYSYEKYRNGLKKKPISHKGKIFRSQTDTYHSGIVHGIIRTQIIIDTFKFLKKYEVPVNFGDRVFMCMIMINGDIVYLQTIAGIRSYGTRIMHHNPDLYTKQEISPREIIMHQDIIDGLFTYYEQKNDTKLAPGIKSEILYFLMKTSGSLNNYENKTTFIDKIKNILFFIGAYLEPIKLSFLNKSIKEDIELSMQYMKKFSLKERKC